MGSSADATTTLSSETNAHAQQAERTPRTAIGPGPLGIDTFNQSFPHISELNVGNIFASQKKNPQAPLLLSSSPRSGAVVRCGAVTKGLSLVGGFGNETSSLSSFDLEYALLEQALKKDSNGTTPVPAEVQAPLERRPVHNILEPEFYFSDILGDNGIPPQSLVTGQGNLYNAADVPSEKNEHEGNHERIDAEITNALAGLVGSDVSADFAEEGIAGGRVNSQLLPRTATRESQEASNTCLYARNMGGSSYNGNGTTLRDMKNISSVGRIAKQRRRLLKEAAAANFEKDPFLVIKTDNSVEDSKAQSHLSDSSISGAGTGGVGIGSHPDLYENLSDDIREKVDRLKATISSMPRRKLREYLARLVSIDDVEPLMCVNRDELADMLGLGVTTWKMFVHHTLGIPRWPARALKSQKVKEKKLLQKKMEAEQRGEYDVADRIQRELSRLTQAHIRRRKLFRDDVNMRVSHGMIEKKRSLQNTYARSN